MHKTHTKERKQLWLQPNSQTVLPVRLKRSEAESELVQNERQDEEVLQNS